MQNKQLFDKIIEESTYLLILIAISLIGLKILFFKESFVVILRLVLSFFWVIIIPGIIIMFYWEDKLSFTERLVIGVGVSTAIIGITSYYLGIIGLNIKFHSILLPIILIALGTFILLKKKPSSDKNNESQGNSPSNPN